MTPDTDKLLSQFMDAWLAGERPDAHDYLERAPEADRDALAESIADWLTLAPTPDPPGLSAALHADPRVRALQGRFDEVHDSFGAYLAGLRARTGLTVAQVAERLRTALLPDAPAHADARVAQYLTEFEQDERPARTIPRRTLDALAGVLQADGDRLARNAALGIPAPAGALYRASSSADAGRAAGVLADAAQAMGTPSQERFDEVDALFLDPSAP